ncbi:hypothetical protein AZL_d03980 (plasmid) [Azospirillum sp. B510]|uniref:hypothetical protein n=1 Tax=Azospirillum sp. (strain B510) TaxID=137722 RepID=UPI0001C4C91C|nr:hypothetical protein [Azospirillum sp. B510]BAI76224.1 hypothetical protein AZL_d03980 [Azospirillum sp. B510]
MKSGFPGEKDAQGFAVEQDGDDVRLPWPFGILQRQDALPPFPGLPGAQAIQRIGAALLDKATSGDLAGGPAAVPALVAAGMLKAPGAMAKGVAGAAIDLQLNLLGWALRTALGGAAAVEKTVDSSIGDLKELDVLGGFSRELAATAFLAATDDEDRQAEDEEIW